MAGFETTESNGTAEGGFPDKYAQEIFSRDWNAYGCVRFDSGHKEQNRPEDRAMQTQGPHPAPPKSAPAPQTVYPNLAPRPEQGVNPQALRQQEQAQQQVQQ